MLSGQPTTINFIVFSLTRSRLELTIYHTRCELADHYTVTSVWTIISMENEHYKYLTQRVGQVQNKHNHHSNYSKQFVLTMISLKKITWRLKQSLVQFHLKQGHKNSDNTQITCMTCMLLCRIKKVTRACVIIVCFFPALKQSKFIVLYCIDHYNVLHITVFKTKCLYLCQMVSVLRPIC